MADGGDADLFKVVLAADALGGFADLVRSSPSKAARMAMTSNASIRVKPKRRADEKS